MAEFVPQWNRATQPTLAPAPEATTPIDWLKGFGTSAVSSAGPELIGMNPLPGATEFRTEHPWAGFASQVLPLVVPYGGWEMGVMKLPKVAKAIQGIGDLEKAPIITQAARQAAIFAPFEAGRVAANAAFGDTSNEDMAGTAAFDLALAAGVGGLIQGVASAGSRSPTVTSIFKGLNLTAPVPLQLREMRRQVAGGLVPETQLPTANARIAEFDARARGELAPKAGGQEGEGRKYVFGLPKQTERALNRMFNVEADTPALNRRNFTNSLHGFEGPDAWKTAAQTAGLPENFPELGQYFRDITFNPKAEPKKIQAATEKFKQGEISFDELAQIRASTGKTNYPALQAKIIDTALTRGMTPVGDGWLMVREEPRGMFVMAKKVQGELGKGDTGDRWVLFKTDRPGDFHPAGQQYMDQTLANAAWIPGFEERQGIGEVYDATKSFLGHFPTEHTEQLAKLPGKYTVANALDKITPQGLKGTGSEMRARLIEAYKEYFAPRDMQFKGQPIAQSILAATKYAHDVAESLTHKDLYGEQRLGKNALVDTLLGRSETINPGDNIRDIVNTFTDQELKDWQFLHANQTPLEKWQDLVAEGKISQSGMEKVAKLKAIADRSFAGAAKTAEELDLRFPKGLEGHLGVTRTWEGNTRIALKDENGNVRGYASGATKAAAQKNAQRLAQKYGWRAAESVDLDAGARIPSTIQGMHYSGDFTHDRIGMRGFKYDLQPPTRRELMDEYANNIRERYKYQAMYSARDLTAREHHILREVDPKVARQVDERIGAYSGIQGTFGKLQNQAADRILAPVLGKNSASKLVHAANAATGTLNLGFFKLSFVLGNFIGGELQGLLPNVAFLLSRDITPEMASVRGFHPVMGTKGIVGSMGVLDPAKILWQSFRLLKSPDSDFLWAMNRALNDRTIDPKFAEEVIGGTSRSTKDWRNAFSNPRNFTEWFLNVANLLPQISERLVRSHSFATGWTIATKVKGITDPELAYQEAKLLTEKSQFLYSAADRPKVFTGPLGSALGLFKTWQMNYIGMMADYFGLAMKENVWAPLLWQTAGTLGVGGLAATPLYAVAQGFNNAFSKQSLLANSYEMMNDDMADLMLYGLPAALTGISMYSQFNSPLSDPVRDASMLFSVASWDRAMFLKSAMGSAFDNWYATGEHPGANEEFRMNLIRAFAPTTMQRVLQTYGTEGGIESLATGYPVIENVPVAQRLMYWTGFNPVQIDKAFAVSDELYRNNEERKARVALLGKQYLQAWDSGDSQAQDQIFKQSMYWGINPSSVFKSAKLRWKLGQESMVERLAGRRGAGSLEAVVESDAED